MKVIGVGVGRTGTLSLKVALERLGRGPCFHGRHVLDHPGRLPLWEAAAAGRPVDWTAVLAGYRSTVDWPAAAFWRQLSEAFPEARVVLTVREAEAWYGSIERTIYRVYGDGPADERVRAARRAVPGLDAVAELHRTVIWDGFFSGRFADRAYAIGVYERHNAAVIRDFLGVVVPAEPYPHLNDMETFWARLNPQRAGST